MPSPEKARDLALQYAGKDWPGIETAQWDEQVVEHPLGVGEVAYTYEAWTVNVSYVVVPSPDYDVTIANHIRGLHWEGTVKADGTVEGSELDDFVGLAPIFILASTPSAFEGKVVTLVGEYCGWQSEGGQAPPVTRSDWVLNDGTGEIYVTGKSPDLDPVADVGKMLTVIGTMRLSDGVPYLEALDIKEGTPGG